jgi:hypothetical protein
VNGEHHESTIILDSRLEKDFGDLDLTQDRKYKIQNSHHRWIHSTCPLHLLERATRSDSKPASFVHNHVRHFLFRGLARGFKLLSDMSLMEEQLDQTRSACSRIQDLFLVRKLILRSLLVMELQRLSVHWELSFLDFDPHQAFLTHLFIVDVIVYPYHIRLPSFLANYASSRISP